jgi:hypothetical protein
LRKRLQLVQQKTLHMLSIQGLYERHLNRRLNANTLKQLTPQQDCRRFCRSQHSACSQWEPGRATMPD